MRRASRPAAGDRRRRRRAGSPRPTPSPAAAGRRAPAAGRAASGRSAPRSASQAVSKPATSVPTAARERLVVGDAVRVAVDEAHERVGALLADEVVDGRDALRIGEAGSARTSSGTGRPSACSGISRSGRGRALDRRPVRRREPLREIDRDALVEPARREVVRVADGGVEDEVGQLVGNGSRRPRRPRRRSARSARTSSGSSEMRRPDDVLPGAGTQRVVEGVLVGVDEEVDGIGLGDAQEVRGVPDTPSPRSPALDARTRRSPRTSGGARCRPAASATRNACRRT